MSTRTTLKTYFVTGATPTEAQFASLIDSAVNVTDDLTASLALDDATKVLTADGAKALKDALDLIDTRVVTLEAGEVEFAGDYYNKTEIDSRIVNIGLTIDSVDATNDAVSAAIDTRVTALEAADTGFAALVHAHTISDVTGLQTALDAKATTTSLASEVSTINTAMLGLAAEVHTHVMADITDLASIDLSLYATLVQLEGKANSTHSHVASEITDIGDDFYTKAEVDTKVAAVDDEHTHLEVDVTDLDKYTQAQTDNRIQAHDDLTDNPHSVNKTQVGLGLVENLDTAGIFNSSAATTFVSQNVTPVNDSIVAHAANVSNPHSVSKTQVGLSNVPNVDVEALLTAHEAASNPHNINLSFFDVFSKAETNTRIEYYISAKIYNFTPASATDSAGALGDLTYDSTKLHIKTGLTAWLSFYDTTAVDAADAAIQADVDQNEADADAGIAANAAALATHEADTTNPHSVTAAQAGAYTTAQTDTAISSAIAALIDGAPAALDTLNELAAAINDDASFATTVTNLITANTTALTTHEADTANPHSVTKTQVGLSNVDNVQQTPLSYQETDVSLGSDSDDRWASVKAIRAYVLANSYAGP